MPAAMITLPDGQRARVTFQTPDQLDATVSDLVKAHPKKDTLGDMQERVNPLARAQGRLEEAVGEPALQAATGVAGAAAGGVAGVARGVGAGAAALAQGEGFEKAREAFTNEATDTIHNVEQAVTRQPKTATGQRAAEIVQTPFTLLARGADVAGAKVAEVTGSPALGAAVNTAIQAAPAAIFPAAKGVTRLASRMRTPPAAAAEAMTATGTPRTPPSQVGDVPRGTPAQGPGEAPGAAQPQPGPGPGASPTSERAASYARRIGLDWARLGAGTRKALETIAQDATALDRLNPAAVRRQAHLESLRVPVRATAGQLTRDPVQLRREAVASNTTEGQPIRDIDVGANRDLQANLEVLRGRLAGRRGSDFREPVTEEGEEVPGALRGPTKTQSQVGGAVQEAVREKAKFSKKAYQALYKRARETEPDARAPVAPVQALLESNPEIQHLGWVQGWLSKARSVLPKDAEGNAPPLTDVTLNELHDLRSKANDIARTGGKEGYYAGQVVRAVDEAMQNVPEGAAAWKRANDAFRAHQQQFGDQGIISKLANQKKGTKGDPQLALEQTWKEIATGPLAKIRQVKQTLLKGTDRNIRIQGAKAWRDLRAETVNRILEDARNVTGADETERAILTEAALRKSIKRIPRENLEELIGKGATRELYNILRARRITTRSPVGGRTTQSGTVPNALVLAERVLKHIPGVKYVVGAKHAVQDLGERGAAARATREAGITPLEQAARDVQTTRPNFSREQRAAQYQSLEAAGATLPGGPPPQPLPIGAALKRPPP